MTKEEILKEFGLFHTGQPGIGGWLAPETDNLVFERLGQLPTEPLTKVQLNQLLVLGHEAPVSDGFFKYYFRIVPEKHPYDCEQIPGFDHEWLGEQAVIRTIGQLKWGLYRLFIDGLLYFGNVRTAFRELRNNSFEDLIAFFSAKRVSTESIKERGPAMTMNEIAKDNRYLISEMACKSYGEDTAGDLKKALLEAYKTHQKNGGGSIKIRSLLSGESVSPAFSDRQTEFIFSADELLDEVIGSEAELHTKYERVEKEFSKAREIALLNTRLYLSLVSELDVYVATSMRTRQDFREMASACETIFGHSQVKPLHLRYFDPTLSAAAGHEDKGLIECLMVKCAKALVYCAGEKESYGKDAEAAMALSLGKPVIFYCHKEQRSRFYREVHPLSRLIHFDSGVAVGAMVTDSLEEVSELLYRWFENKMEYVVENQSGRLRLREKLTNSVVRLQTSDQLLSATFWNHYHAAKQPQGLWSV